MAFNIFSTLNQNLQNFWGDAYDAYQAWKSKVGNVASTINNNLQDFWGDIYDVGSTIKKNVSNFWTQTYNQGKQAVNQIESNVSQFGTDVANKASAVKKSILAPADRFMTDVTKIGNARKATQYGISEKDKAALMNQMLDAGQYSDDEIIQAVAQLDAEEKARKQKEFSDWEKWIRENASTTWKILWWAVDFIWGAEAGMMRLPAWVTDFVTGGTDYTKDTLKGINDFSNSSGMAKVGDIAGQIAGTALIPWVGRIAPSGTSLAATAGRGAVYGGAFGGLTPIMEKGSEATGGDIAWSALGGAAMGAVAGPLLEKGIPALIKGTQSGIKAGQYAQGGIADKIWAGWQAFVKSMWRQTKQWVNEVVGSISSAYQKSKPFVKDTVKAPYKFTQGKVQSLLSNSSDKTKNTIAQMYNLENQEIGALRNMGEKGVSDAMKRMEAIDKTALEWGGVNSIYDDLHKEIMTGVGRRSKEISTLEAQKDKILQSSPVVVTQSELESIFDDVLKSQGIQRTQKMTKKGVKNTYSIVGEGNITSSDIANIEKLYNEVFRTKWDVSALNMNTRIKNLQGNLYNSDGAAVYGSNSMTSTAKSIVAKVNDLLKKKLPAEYGMAKEAQSKILQQRQTILKALKEEDNALALLSDDAIANMSEEAVTKLINDSIAGNKMALVLRRLANSTTTGGDAKQLANIIKEFTGVDAESKAIALRAIAKLTGNQQIMNELGGLIEKGIMKWTLWFVRKTLAPSPDKVIKAVATKPSIVPKAKPRATTESPFKNNKGFINPSEIKKSLIPKKWADEARQFYDDLVYAGNSPIVAQRETAKRFGTIRAMSASKAGTMELPEALAQEARKYKSAEEFIKSKWKPVYHGTTKANYDSINTNWFDISKNTKWYAEDPHAIFLSKYSDNGSDHSAGTYGSHIVEAYINPNAKILDLDSNMGYDLIWRISPKVMKEEWMKTKYDYVIKKWYDAIDYWDWEIAVFNPSLIKTKSQLKQIYEQANKK